MFCIMWCPFWHSFYIRVPVFRKHHNITMILELCNNFLPLVHLDKKPSSFFHTLAFIIFSCSPKVLDFRKYLDLPCVKIKFTFRFFSFPFNVILSRRTSNQSILLVWQHFILVMNNWTNLNVKAWIWQWLMENRS